MPTYDFKCKTCGHRFSQRVAIKDRELVRCPQCGGRGAAAVYRFSLLR